MNRQTNGKGENGWTDKRTGGQIDRWTDGQMDRWTGFESSNCDCDTRTEKMLKKSLVALKIKKKYFYLSECNKSYSNLCKNINNNIETMDKGKTVIF
jgi:hypothetical protein